MDFLKLLPILFIAHQPSSLVETRAVDQNRQLLPESQPDFVPVYIATGNSPPDVEALEAFYRKEASTSALVDGKKENESPITTAASPIHENNGESESSTTVKVTETIKETQTKEEPVKNESTIENVESSTQLITETAKPEVVRKVTQYEVTEEQQE